MIDAHSATLTYDLQQALLVLRQGGVVAFPTETYYGLAVDPFNGHAVDHLFELKRRPAVKPVLVLIDGLDQLARLTVGVPEQFSSLMGAFWPGPLTLIFSALPSLCTQLTAGTGTIGLRISSHPFARQLCLLAGGAITATSANRSGSQPARTEQEVVAQFGHEVDWVVKGGPTRGGLASTIIAAKPGGGLCLVREGVIPFAEACSCLAMKSSAIDE
ncbi:MAG: L-threonylcarbamoyladenylate synthase [Desulfobulbaceae bacterium]|nr:L-threonylcarbamoyladenylate synthase [Desulfobulbaceae bacterium]